MRMNKEYINNQYGSKIKLISNARNPKVSRVKDEKYVIYHKTDKDVFFVWSTDEYKKAAGNDYPGKKSSYNIKTNLGVLSSDTLKYEIQSVGCKNSSNKYTTFIIGNDYFEEYLSSVESLDKLFADVENTKVNFDLINNYEQNPKQKIKEITSRGLYTQYVKKRRSNFRAKVFSKCDNPKCALCGCDILEILEVAHKKGHEVYLNNINDDIPENGIILCRVHHKLYDADLIRIENNTMEIVDEKLKDNQWFRKYPMQSEVRKEDKRK